MPPAGDSGAPEELILAIRAAAFDLDAALSMADAEFGVDGRFTDVLVAPVFDVSTKLQHPNAAAMLQMVGAIETGASVDEGPVGVSSDSSRNSAEVFAH